MFEDELEVTSDFKKAKVIKPTEEELVLYTLKNIYQVLKILTVVTALLIVVLIVLFVSTYF